MDYADLASMPETVGGRRNRLRWAAEATKSKEDDAQIIEGGNLYWADVEGGKHLVNDKAFLLDLDAIKIGYVLSGEVPETQWSVNLRSFGEPPTTEWKKAFTSNVLFEDADGNEIVASFGQNSVAGLKAFLALVADLKPYKDEVEAGKCPWFKLEEIKTFPGQSGDVAFPVFRVTDWADRPAAFDEVDEEPMTSGNSARDPDFEDKMPTF